MVNCFAKLPCKFGAKKFITQIFFRGASNWAQSRQKKGHGHVKKGEAVWETHEVNEVGGGKRADRKLETREETDRAQMPPVATEANACRQEHPKCPKNVQKFQVQRDQKQNCKKLKITRIRSQSQRVVRNRSRNQRVIRSRSQRVIRNRSRSQRVARNRSRSQRVARNRSRSQRVTRNRSRSQRVTRNRSRSQRVIRNRSRSQRVAKARSQNRSVARVRSRSHRIINTR
uniref:Uncharacterized protein n=1 Tax=Xenopus tropicalis TaxID=8364 RepID=A0A803JGQ5_XENTR